MMILSSIRNKVFCKIAVGRIENKIKKRSKLKIWWPLKLIYTKNAKMTIILEKNFIFNSM